MRSRYPGLQNSQMDQEDANTHRLVSGTWRDDVGLIRQSMERMQARKSTIQATECRRLLVEYVNGVGSVDWQNDMI